MQDAVPLHTTEERRFELATLRESDFIPSRRWRGRWIWCPGPGVEKNVYYYFRKEFDLNEVPNTAALRMTADTRYRMYATAQVEH